MLLRSLVFISICLSKYILNVLQDHYQNVLIESKFIADKLADFFLVLSIVEMTAAERDNFTAFVSIPSPAVHVNIFQHGVICAVYCCNIAAKLHLSWRSDVLLSHSHIIAKYTVDLCDEFGIRYHL